MTAGQRQRPSLTAPRQGWYGASGQPRAGGRLHAPLGLWGPARDTACSVQSGYCLDDLFVARLPPSACSFSCSLRGRLEISLSTSIGIHGSVAPSAPSLRYLRQQENPRSHGHVPPRVARSTTTLPSSHLSGASHVSFMCGVQSFNCI